MELNDVLRRTVGQHWRLLAVFMLVGLGVGLAFAPSGKMYAASTRLVLDTPDPVGRQQSQAYADTAKAIATSRSQVATALAKARIRRGDPAAYAKTHVSVTGLGTSGVVQLTVTDREPRVAAAVANALSAQVISTRLAVTNGQTQRVFADLDSRIAKLNAKISGASAYMNRIGLRVATTPQNAALLRAKRSGVEEGIALLVQQRSVLQSQRLSLLTATAQRPRPAVISAAVPPSAPVPSHGATYIVLGGLLGLIAGLGAAGLIETIRPTLVGGDTLAGELDAALLGSLEQPVPAATVSAIQARLRLAAAAAQVGNVALISAGPGIDLKRLADSLAVSVRPAAASAGGASRHVPDGGGGDEKTALRIGPFIPETPPVNNGVRNGLVLVSPSALRKTELNDVSTLLRISGLPLLGVITYAPPDEPLLRRMKDRVRSVAEQATA